MTNSIHSQISQKRRDIIDALSKEELRFEISRGRESRFSKSLPYLEYRLQQIIDEEAGRERDKDLLMAREANYLSKEANQISGDANRLSKWAIWIAILAFLVSGGMLGFDVYQEWHSNKSFQADAAEPRD